MASWQAVAFLPPGADAVGRTVERIADYGCTLPPSTRSVPSPDTHSLLVVDFDDLPRHVWRGTVAAMLWAVSATPGALGMVVDWDAVDAADEWIAALRSAELWPPERRSEAPLVLSRTVTGAGRLRIRPDAFFLRG